jgi:hypothetical protein
VMICMQWVQVLACGEGSAAIKVSRYLVLQTGDPSQSSRVCTVLGLRVIYGDEG